MKKVFVFFLLVFLLISCEKDDKKENFACNNLTTYNYWTKIDFKSNYTIQLPHGFDGAGMVGFEGNTFNKKSKDNKIILSYMYCSPLFCYDFGDTLQNSIPKSIQVMGSFDMPITLSDIEYFCQNSETIGVLYYSTDGDITKSRLYWKEHEILRQALEIEFYLSEIDTVIKIIETIKNK